MKVSLTIDCRNDALTGSDAVHEVGRLLRQTADRIEAGQDYGRLTEYNGNGCGNWYLEDEPEPEQCRAEDWNTGQCVHEYGHDGPCVDDCGAEIDGNQVEAGE
jgi:hypothetical protein